MSSAVEVILGTSVASVDLSFADSPPITVGLTAAAQSTIEVALAAVGPPGADGEGDLHYLHDQGSASDTWVITHNLGKYPSVTVVDSAGDECEGSVNYSGVNTLTVTFSSAFSGRAYLN